MKCAMILFTDMYTRGLRLNGFCCPTRTVAKSLLPDPTRRLISRPTRTRGYGSGRVNLRVRVPFVFAPLLATDRITASVTWQVTSLTNRQQIILQSLKIPSNKENEIKTVPLLSIPCQSFTNGNKWNLHTLWLFSQVKHVHPSPSSIYPTWPVD